MLLRSQQSPSFRNLSYWYEMIWFATNSSINDATHTNIKKSNMERCFNIKGFISRPPASGGTAGIRTLDLQRLRRSLYCRATTIVSMRVRWTALRKTFNHFWDGIIVKSRLGWRILLKGCSLSIGHPFYRNWTTLPSITFATCHRGTDKNCDVLANGKWWETKGGFKRQRGRQL